MDNHVIEGFKAIGVQLHDKHGKIRDMVAIAQDLKNTMNGLSDKQRALKFDKLGLNQEAAMGLSIMMNNTSKLKDTRNSAGQLAQAYNNSATSLDTWTQILNFIKIQLMGIGDTILTLITPALQWIKNHLQQIKLFVQGL